MALPNISILLFEVEASEAEMITEYLAQQGCTWYLANNLDSATKVLKQESIDLVIADLSLPNSIGLDLIAEIPLISPPTHSIVISGNNVLSDVLQAIRLGASDYLCKPIDDMLVLENAIQQTMVGFIETDAPMALLDELSYQEFDEHISSIEQSSHAVEHIQQQLFPAAEATFPNAQVSYSIFKHTEVSNYLIDSTLVSEKYLMVYMAHFQPENKTTAFASVTLRSLVNQKLQAFRIGKSQSVIEPFNMLSYLNDRIVKSGLGVYIDMIYAIVDLNNFRTAIAQAGHGLRSYIRNSEGLMPIAISDSMQIGVQHWVKTSTQYRTLNRGENLCISTSKPEHKPLLLSNRFSGLVKNEAIPTGGYVEVRV
ncbi:response regulator [Parashewanella curva]|uniref:Response regulator n=1 Tax=Parashewanella curva TaxID=2338552 RepID=A0A3L8Q3D8_9GAMM|nr:response regulator [Parashewanella curva]RLV61593.1 response regulator [Parashewanella curva]